MVVAKHLLIPRQRSPVHLRVFNLLYRSNLNQSLRFALSILRLDITSYPPSETRQFNVKGVCLPAHPK